METYWKVSTDNFHLFQKTFILRMLFYVMREAVGKTLLNLIKLKITKLKLKEIENSARLFFDPLFDFFLFKFFLS